MSEEGALNTLNKMGKLDTQEEIKAYLNKKYGISEVGIENVFEDYSEKQATNWANLFFDYCFYAGFYERLKKRYV